MSAVLDEIAANASDYPYIDTDQISIFGFSAGGCTAMATAAARVDPDLLQGFCDDTDHGMSDCAFLDHFGVDLHALDLSPAAQDLRDIRITTAVIIDPEIVETMTAESLAQIDIPMLIINLGDEDIRLHRGWRRVSRGDPAQVSADTDRPARPAAQSGHV